MGGMAKAGVDGKPQASADETRHVYGPRAMAALVPALVRPAYRKRAPATAQVLADWPAIVGPALAAVTMPRRLFSGTLSIGCSGSIAVELQHLSPQIISRINAHLGQVAVTRLRFVQQAPSSSANRPAVRTPAVAAARAAVSALPAGDLRDALERLGQVVLARR